MLDDVQYQSEGVVFLQRVVEGTCTAPLLLVGDEGVGRRYSVVQALKEAFCLKNKSSTCKCYGCLSIDQGVHPDVTFLSGEAEKDIGVEPVRQILEDAMLYPSSGPFRAFVVDGADHLSIAAANALLKTLEEPPETVRFFLLAESFTGVLDTIRSRCGRVSYKRLPEKFVLQIVQRFEPDPTKALVYTRMGEGSAGRAVRFWGAGRAQLRDRILTLLESGLQGDLSSVFSLVDELDADLSLGLRFLEQILHDLLVLSYDPSRIINLDSKERLITMQKQGKAGQWARLWERLRALQELRHSVRVNLAFHVKTLFAETLFA